MALAYGAVFVGALILRVAYVLELSESPLALVLMGDAASYHNWAQRLQAGDWLGGEVFYQAPLYPYALAIQYRVLGESLVGVRISQAFLGAFSCLFLAYAGTHWFGARAGILAGTFLAVYSPALFFGGVLQKTTLATFFLCALLALLSRDETPPLTFQAAGAGALIGALALTRENSLLLTLPVLAWLYHQSGSARWRRIAIAVCCMMIPLGPVLLRNYVIGGGFHLTTSQLGPNLFIGNNPRATGYYVPLREGRQDARFESVDARAIAERHVGMQLSPSEVSSFYVKRVLNYIESQPVEWLQLMLRKLALVWNAAEVGDTEDLYAFASHFRILSLTLPLHFGLIVPLTAIGIVVTWKHRQKLYLLYALIATYALSVVVFYIFARYRFPLVPMSLLFASAAIIHGFEWYRSQTILSRCCVAAVAVLVAIISNWPLVDRSSIQATTHYNFARGLADIGDKNEALEEFQRALHIEPTFAMARNERGVVLASLGRNSEAVAEFERAAKDDPQFVTALTNLGELQLRQGRLGKAEESFVRALRVSRDNVSSYAGLARIFYERGNLDAAYQHFQRALELEPQNAGAHNNLGVIAARRGFFKEAVEHFRAALLINPSYEEARKNLAKAQQALSNQ